MERITALACRAGPTLLSKPFCNTIAWIASALFWSFGIFLASCTPKPMALATVSPSFQEVPKDLEVLMLDPFLKFERLQDETVLAASTFQGKELEEKMRTAARDALISRHLVGATCGSLEEPLAASCVRLGSSLVSQGAREEGASRDLQNLASLDSRYAVLSQSLLVKVGPKGFWSPTNGAIGSSLSTTRLQVSVIQCSTGKTLWRNEVFLRQLPSAEGSQFSASLKLLYDGFLMPREGK